MSKNPLMISVSLLMLLSAMGQQSQAPPKPAPAAPYTIPREAVSQANPVKPTPESLAEGKKWYGYDCVMCHGKNGDGKGDVGADMKLKVSDFTDPETLKARTDGELFYIIKNGKGDMPPEGNRLKSDGLWNLVNYVRSLAKKGNSVTKQSAAIVIGAGPSLKTPLPGVLEAKRLEAPLGCVELGESAAFLLN